jgi:putative flippase GtrA
MSMTALSFPAREVPRYVVAGGVNTLASWLVYVALLQVATYRVAYAASFVFGVALSFLLNSWFVFGVPLRWRRLVPYPGVYLAQFAVGYAVVWLAVEKAGWPAWSGPLAALAFTIPVGFILTRRVLVPAAKGLPVE